MRKKLSNSFKTKLLLLFMLISAVPLVLAVSISAMNMIADAQENIENEGLLRNRLAQEKISELYEKNLDVLRVLAASPVIKQYLITHAANPDAAAEDLIVEANAVLHDGNNIVITDTKGQQLLRTDGLPLVNVVQRGYFWEAMSGKEAISEVLVSLATGRFISVIEVPIFDDADRPIGMVQRSYDLMALQMFVRSLATEHTRVIILDKEGKTLAHSGRLIQTEEDRTDESGYDFVGRALAGESGYVTANIEGEESFVSYSKNKATGWAIVTVQPGNYIQQKIYKGALMAAACGLALLLIISVAAYLLADKIAQPIIELSRAVLNVASSSPKKNFVALAGDELKQMATAFDHIRISANALRKEAEVDKLTQVYNKATMERFCRESLKDLKSGKTMAMYVIDLDHFKQANDTKGHQFGDLILQEFARQLKDIFKPEDYLGRFGGDEFVAFVPDAADAEFISQTAVKVMQTARNLCINDEPAGITTSIGISTAPPDGNNYESLFDMADKALYEVKRKGRDGYCLDRSTVVHE